VVFSAQSRKQSHNEFHHRVLSHQAERRGARDIGSDFDRRLDAAMVKAKSLFDTLDMPQAPDGLRILDQVKQELFVWKPDDDVICNRQ
jgi:hypothetical protein